MNDEHDDDITRIDHQELDPALAAYINDDTGERRLVVNSQQPHKRALAALRKLIRKSVLGFAPFVHLPTHLMEPGRRLMTEQAVAAVCGVAVLVGVGGTVVSSGADVSKPQWVGLPSPTHYVERVPAPLSTPSVSIPADSTSEVPRPTPRPERPAFDGDPTRIPPTSSPTTSASPSREAAEAGRTPSSPTPTLEPTPTAEATPPVSSEPQPTPKPTPAPEPVASVGVDLEELDVDVEVDLGDVEVDLDVDLGSALGGLTR